MSPQRWALPATVLPDGHERQLWVVDGRLTSRAAEAAEPLPGRFTLPGLVDAHAHVSLGPAQVPLDLSATADALRRLPVTGVLAVRDVGSPGDLVLDLVPMRLSPRCRPPASGWRPRGATTSSSIARWHPTTWSRLRWRRCVPAPAGSRSWPTGPTATCPTSRPSWSRWCGRSTRPAPVSRPIRRGPPPATSSRPGWTRWSTPAVWTPTISRSWPPRARPGHPRCWPSPVLRLRVRPPSVRHVARTGSTTVAPCSRPRWP